MKLLRFNKCCIFLLFCLNGFPFSAFPQSQNLQYFSTLPHISIRALEVLNDSTVWFAANHGVWGYTVNAGKTWKVDSIQADAVYPEFRSVAALNDSTILLLSIGTPAYLFKTTNKGKTWRLVYTNHRKDIFFDSMKFWNEKEGIAVGDPMQGCFEVIKTRDGGETWNQVKCENIPGAGEGEACFAASNTCIDIFENNVWFATGGKHSRIFKSTDFGTHFIAYGTPIIQGELMTGIYSVDFSDKNFGVIAGGNYDKTDSTMVGLALTTDGGLTWKAIKTERPLFGSCIQITGETLFNVKTIHHLIVTGHDGTYEWVDDGKQFAQITDLKQEKLKFNTLRASANNKNVIWFAGSKGMLARLTKNP